MIIRQYDSREKKAVLALLRLNTPTYFDASEEAELVNYLEQEVEDYFVVYYDDQLIAAGGINYFVQDAHARISWDIVHPEFQGKGVGRLLTAHRIAILKKQEAVERVTVRTSQHTQGFYAKQGFRLTKHTPDFWAKGFDLCHMEMSLVGK